jgi:hypothetical protein
LRLAAGVCCDKVKFILHAAYHEPNEAVIKIIRVNITSTDHSSIVRLCSSGRVWAAEDDPILPLVPSRSAKTTRPETTLGLQWVEQAHENTNGDDRPLIWFAASGRGLQHGLVLAHSGTGRSRQITMHPFVYRASISASADGAPRDGVGARVGSRSPAGLAGSVRLPRRAD